MLDWPEEPQPEFALLADGVPVGGLYPLDVERSLRKLSELRAHIPRFPTNPADLGQMLVDREVTMAACFTHRAQRLVDGGLTRIAISFEQARLQTEYAVVWKNAPNRENAMRFLAHIVKAQPQATWAQVGHTGPLNPEAFRLVSPEMAAELPTSPSHRSAWAKNDDGYAAAGAGGKTNRELLAEQWRMWVAACGPFAGERDLAAWRGALVGSRTC
jgi:putative spermidine/putrescine transport system substrate-binding protein